jgi:15-cis-phytoene desaturase
MTESGVSSRLATPPRIKQTQNWRDAAALSTKFADEPVDQTKRKRVAIIGGGLSGLSCAKYLADAGHIPVVVSEMHIS